jgi:hypothetical protein
MNDYCIVFHLFFVVVASVDGKNQRGLHSLCYALKQNKYLKTLSLSHNDIKDSHVELLAQSLHDNEHLLVLDVSNNALAKHWFDKECVVSTAQRGDVPSLAHSLHRNANLDRQRRDTYDSDHNDHEFKRRIVDNVLRGEWTQRREWHTEREKDSERQARKAVVAKEFDRIRQEREWLAEQIENQMLTIRLYLEEVACQDFLNSTAQHIANYARELPTFSVAKFGGEMMLCNRIERARVCTAGSRDRQRSKSIKIIQAISSKALSVRCKDEDVGDTNGLSNKDNGKHNITQRGNKNKTKASDRRRGRGKEKDIREQEKIIETEKPVETLNIQQHVDPSDTNSSMLTSLMSMIGIQRREEISNEITETDWLRVEAFTHSHLAVVHAVVCVLEGEREGEREGGLLLHPQRLQQALLALCLPVLPSSKFNKYSMFPTLTLSRNISEEVVRDELQSIVDYTLVPQKRMLALHKLCDLLLLQSQRIVQISPSLAMRLRSSLSLSPPLDEARALILSFYRYQFIQERRNYYRSLPDNAPLYVCAICEKRFASQSLFEKHKRRTIHEQARGRQHPIHDRLLLRNRVSFAQSMFLQRVRYAVTGSFVPAYFEMLPDSKLPRDYLPQIMDKLGQQVSIVFFVCLFVCLLLLLLLVVTVLEFILLLFAVEFDRNIFIVGTTNLCCSRGLYC